MYCPSVAKMLTATVSCHTGTTKLNCAYVNVQTSIRAYAYAHTAHTQTVAEAVTQSQD